MPALSLRLRTTCSTCGHPVPLTHARRECVPCPTCDAPVTRGDEAFAGVMRPGVAPRGPGEINRINRERLIRERFRRMAAGVAAGKFSEGEPLLGECLPSVVVCRVCGVSVDDDAIERGVAAGSLSCRAGHAIAVRPVPPEMGQAPWWAAFLGESDSDAFVPTGQPVQFTCASCGGALLVDGTTRAPPCRFCGTGAYLPEELWRTLRPTPRVESFYLWVSPALHDQWTRARGAAFRWAAWTFVAVWPGVLLALLALHYLSGDPSPSQLEPTAVRIWGSAGWMAGLAAAFFVHAKRSPG